MHWASEQLYCRSSHFEKQTATISKPRWQQTSFHKARPQDIYECAPQWSAVTACSAYGVCRAPPGIHNTYAFQMLHFLVLLCLCASF